MLNDLLRGEFDLIEILVMAFCVLLSLSVHEFAHGFAAYKLGDNTAKNMGRLNINPISHLDPIGAICMFLFGFGWAKPVPINPRNFGQGRYKSGMVVTSLAGPVSNLLLAFVSTVLFFLTLYLFRQGSIGLQMEEILTMIFMTLASLNLSLAVFNLIPIPPLDGSKILNAILPARIYFKIMEYEQYGFIVLILLINLPFFRNILIFLVNGIWRFYVMIIELTPLL